MMNSRYAPIVALTVLFVFVIAGLGYFFAVKPQLDDASNYASRESGVRDNITKIEANSTALDQAKVDLAAAPDISERTAINAPQSLDLPEFMTRLGDAVRASKTEIRAVNVENAAEVEGFEFPAAVLPSTKLVSLFETVQTPREPGEPRAEETFAPVVVEPTPEQTATGNLVEVDLMVSVKGRPEEVAKFLKLMEDPEKRIFLTWDLEFAAWQTTDSDEPGLFAWLDGDSTIEMRGSLFLLNPDYSVIDELTKGDYTVPKKTSPAEQPETVDPQPGNPGK